MRSGRPVGGLGSRRELLIVAVACSACIHLIYARIASPVAPLWDDWHEVMMRGDASAPLQYRWLSYVLPDVAIRNGVGAQQAYLAMRSVALVAALYIVGETVRGLVAERAAAIAAIAAVALYYAASSFPHIQPAEELNLVFFGLLVLLMLRNSSHLLIVGVFTVAMLNKETVGFLIPFALLLEHHRHGRWRSGARLAGALALSFVVVYVGVRAHFGTDRPYLGGLFQLRNNLDFWRGHLLGGSMWLLPSLLPVAYMVRRWARTPTVCAVFIPTVVLFVAGHLTISAIQEFRTYTVLATITWVGAAVAHGSVTFIGQVAADPNGSHDGDVDVDVGRSSADPRVEPGSTESGAVWP